MPAFINRRSVLILCFALFFSYMQTINAEDVFKWQKISGAWQIKIDGTSGYLFDQYSRSVEYGYSELIDSNSLITLDDFENITSIQAKIELLNPRSEDNHITVFFAAQSYRDFYAFRFFGKQNGFTEVQFIRCSVIDTTLPPSQKNNYKVEVLSSKDFSKQPSEPMNVVINFKGFEAELFVDGSAILKTEAQRAVNSGKFGFSHTNNLLRISDVIAKRGQTEIFSDNFTNQSVKTTIINATMERKPAQ